MSPEPFVSCAKALMAKGSEKGYGEENDGIFLINSNLFDCLFEKKKS